MTQRRERLGEFLRARRARLTPEACGLASNGRRRTPGLRREEVARLAGISAEWYVRLEQGRAVAPPAATVEALGRALRLSEVERAHLGALARVGRRPAFEREAMPAAIRRLVESLPGPAYVTGQRWDLLAWNEAAADLLEGLGTAEGEAHNILLYVLADPRGRALFGEGWACEARRMVALFRATYDLWPDDPAFDALVDALRAGCPDFEGWWAAHDVGAPIAGRKVLYHPRRGRLTFEYATFQANDNPALKLAMYVPSGGTHSDDRPD